MNRCDDLENVLYYTCEDIFDSKNNLLRFFRFSSNLYKYSFMNQVLIYAQKSTATACADMKIWNDYMKCIIKKGTRAIAIFDDTSDNMKVGYVFDMQDVVPDKRYGKLPEKWVIEKEEVLFKKRIQNYLLGKYEVQPVTKNDNLATTVNQIAEKFAGEHTKEFMSLYNLSSEWDRSSVYSFIRAAIVCPVIFRLNIEEQEIYLSDGSRYSNLDNEIPLFNSVIPPNFYNGIKDWSIEQKVALFSYASSFTKDILVDLTKYVRKETRSIETEKVNDDTELHTEKQITLAMLDNHDRENAINKFIKEENENDRIYDNRRLSSSITQSESGTGSGKVRINEKKISERTEKSDVSSIDSDEEIAGGITEVSTDRNGIGATEQNGSGNTESDLPVIHSQEDFIEFLTDDRLAKIIEAAGGYNAESRIELIKAIKDFPSAEDINARIYWLRTYFGAFDDVISHTAYAYRFKGTDDNYAVTYSVDESGLHITQKNGSEIYVKNLSWNRINMIIDDKHLLNSFIHGIKDEWFNAMVIDGGHISAKGMAAIRDVYSGMKTQMERMKFKYGTEPVPAQNEYDYMISKLQLDDYIYASKLLNNVMVLEDNSVNVYPGTPEEVQFEQLSLFDSFAEQQGNISVDNSSFWKPREISDDVVDDILRSGPIDRYHKMSEIYGLYMFEYDKDFRKKRLKECLEKGSKGFTFNNDNITATYIDEGIYIAYGSTSVDKPNRIVEWDEVDNRICDLITDGSFCHTDRDIFYNDEKSRIFSDFAYFVRETYRHDDSEIEYERQKYIADFFGIDDMLHQCLNPKYYNLQLEKIKDNLEQYAEKCIELMVDLKFKIDMEDWYCPGYQYSKYDRIVSELDAFCKGVVYFHEESIDKIKDINESFITDDMINMCLCCGTGFENGSYSVYKHYMENPKENDIEFAKYLSKAYGTGGGTRYGGWDNHDGKGLEISRGLITGKEGLEKISVQLKWNKVAKRIKELIQKGKYISEEKIVSAEYENRVRGIIKDLKENDVVTINGEHYKVVSNNSFYDLYVENLDGLPEDELSCAFSPVNDDRLRISYYKFNRQPFYIEKKNPVSYITSEHIMDDFPLYRKLRDQKTTTKVV